MSDNTKNDAPQPSEPKPQTIEPENKGNEPEPQTIEPEPADLDAEEAFSEDLDESQEDDKMTGEVLERPNHDEDPDEDLDDEFIEDIS